MTSEVESCGPESTFVYDKFDMESTLVTEFDMVCNKSREVVRFLVESSSYPWNNSDMGAHGPVLLHAGPRSRQPGLWTDE